MLSRIALLLVLASSGACAPVVQNTLQDATLTAAVVTALLNSPAVDGTLVTVRAEGGAVYLEGTQPTDAAAAEVTRIANGVSGVRDVQSSIVVTRQATGP